jgi:hypothetical protein
MALTFDRITRSSSCIGVLFSLLLVVANASPFVTATGIDIQQGDRILGNRLVSEDEVLHAKAILMSVGVPERNFCRDKAFAKRENVAEDNNNINIMALPLCDVYLDTEIKGDMGDFKAGELSRILEEEGEEPTFEEDPFFFFVMAFCALSCVGMAALAAGLTMGLLSLDPLMLLVKIRASRSPEQKEQAEAVLPIVKQHHLLLVTLLLLNSMANEALPLFLEKLVSPVASVLLSVTFILM